MMIIAIYQEYTLASKIIILYLLNEVTKRV